jgi:hypothetical protein
LLVLGIKGEARSMSRNAKADFEQIFVIKDVIRYKLKHMTF